VGRWRRSHRNDGVQQLHEPAIAYRRMLLEYRATGRCAMTSDQASLFRGVTIVGRWQRRRNFFMFL